MTTISFDENINITKFKFKTLEDFQIYLVQKLQKSELSSAHKKVIKSRLNETEQNPDNFISFDKLKSSIKRK
ncbi:hypothetical protein MNBD_BACTEROID02-245 [hydrothermal vent metagenome]|uniref:Uncharacterized protein n=1 Tax=hydrothermal vent metagenome TaxID=652676 RepID=A0A3B0R1J2_9ZZZZ